MSKILNCSGHNLQIPNIVKSDGIYLFDNYGKKYMDLESGIWSTSLGHNNIHINNLIKKQIDKIMHVGFCYSSDILQESAKEVLSITNFNGGKCVFLCTGSESIELARQMTKYITKKKRSMTLHDSYLGSYSSVTDRSNNWYIFDWKTCASCLDNENCKTSCEKIQDIPTDISEFIFEPGSSSGFVRFPPKSLIQNITNTIKKQGGKIIANEVTTGIGRTGEWFGYNHYKIEPDIVAMGKGIGNGYPVSVTAINKQITKELEQSTFKYSQSHQNDPLGAAIVNKVIKIIKDNDLISNTRTKGNKFFESLNKLKDDIYITDVRGRGLMFSLDIIDEQIANDIYSELIDKGYIIYNKKSLFRIDPPLIIEENEFNSFIKDFKKILSKLNEK